MFIMSNFVKEVVARLKGDDAQVIAVRNEKRAVAAFKQQLAALDSQVVEDEVAVEKALEDYNHALYPTSEIRDGKAYLLRIQEMKERLDEAEEELQNTKDSIEFFKAEQSKIFKSTK